MAALAGVQHDVVEASANLNTLDGALHDQAVQFIERSAGAPFFLYFAHNAPHLPLACSTRFRGTSPLGRYGDVVDELDWSVGTGVAGPRGQRPRRNTLVMFTSDNGPWFPGSDGTLARPQGETWDGGMRGPSSLATRAAFPAGLTSDVLATTMDLLPTVARLSGGAPLPANPLDGVDLWPLLAGETAGMEHPVFLYFDSWNLQCARLGRWKLHLTRSTAPPGRPRRRAAA